MVYIRQNRFLEMTTLVECWVFCHPDLCTPQRGHSYISRSYFRLIHFSACCNFNIHACNETSCKSTNDQMFILDPWIINPPIQKYSIKVKYLIFWSLRRPNCYNFSYTWFVWLKLFQLAQCMDKARVQWRSPKSPKFSPLSRFDQLPSDKCQW